MSRSEADALWTLLQRDLDVPDLAELVDRPAWQLQASCRGMGPDRFFGGGRGAMKIAKALCASCPVRDPCREAGTAQTLDFGVWGGTSATERSARRVGRSLTGATDG